MSQGNDMLAFQQTIHMYPGKCTLLFDYDLGTADTGLKWLQEIPQSATRCLVTGHFDNYEVQAACVSHGLYLIPKSQIAEMPIVVPQTDDHIWQVISLKASVIVAADLF